MSWIPPGNAARPLGFIVFNSGWGPEPEISGFIKTLLSTEIIRGAESPNLQPGFFTLTHRWVFIFLTCAQ